MGWAKRAGDWSEKKQAEQREREEAKLRQALEKDLTKASSGWTAPMVVRDYEDGDKGQRTLQIEAAIFTDHGYEPWAQNEEGSHIHAGRLILTGGLSVFAGKRGIRGKGKTKVPYRPKPVGQSTASTTQPDIADQLRKLGELRDDGVLTPEEFDAKKAELLARM